MSSTTFTSACHLQVPIEVPFEVRTCLGAPKIRREYVVGDNSPASDAQESIASISPVRIQRPMGPGGDQIQTAPLGATSVWTRQQPIQSGLTGAQHHGGSQVVETICASVVQSGDMRIIRATFDQLLDRYDGAERHSPPPNRPKKKSSPLSTLISRCSGHH